MHLRFILLSLTVFNLKRTMGYLLPERDAYKDFIIRIYGYSPHGSSFDDSKCGKPVFLTPYIHRHNIKKARHAAYVKNADCLPNVESYSGFFTVNEYCNSNIWFWYFPATDKSVKEAPLLIWTSTDPGAYSTYGLFGLFGPYVLDSLGRLRVNHYTWIRKQSLLIFDSPLGSGFSFTESEDGYSTNQTMIGQNLYSALEQFFMVFEEVRKAPITLVGSLIGAKHAVSLGHEIYKQKKRNERSAWDCFNLQGLAFFNGIFEFKSQYQNSMYGLETGLLDDDTAKAVGALEFDAAKAISAGDVNSGITLFNKAIRIFDNSARLPNPLSIAADEFRPPELFIRLLQRADIRSNMHVGNKKLRIAGTAFDKLRKDIYGGSVRHWLEELLNHYNVLFCTGDFTEVAPIHPTTEFINSLEFHSADQFRSANRQFLRFNETVVGYYREANNIIRLTLRNAGNILAAEKPAQTLAIISSFAYTQSLNSCEDYIPYYPYYPHYEYKPYDYYSSYYKPYYSYNPNNYHSYNYGYK